MTFNINNFIQLVKRDFILNKKFLALSIVAIAAFIFIMMLLVTPDSDNNQGMLNIAGPIYIMLLYIGGLSFTAMSFYEFRNHAGRIQFLTLPASHLEKLVTRWLYTSIGYVFVITIIFLILYKVYNPMVMKWWGQQLVPISSLDLNTYWLLIKNYMVLNALALIFAISINRFTIPKAIIILTGLTILGLVASVLIFRIVFNEFFDGWSIHSSQFDTYVPDSKFIRSMENISPNVLINLCLAILLPFFWIVSYFKMKEKQA